MAVAGCFNGRDGLRHKCCSEKVRLLLFRACISLRHAAVHDVSGGREGAQTPLSACFVPHRAMSLLPDRTVTLLHRAYSTTTPQHPCAPPPLLLSSQVLTPVGVLPALSANLHTLAALSSLVLTLAAGLPKPTQELPTPRPSSSLVNPPTSTTVHASHLWTLLLAFLPVFREAARRKWCQVHDPRPPGEQQLSKPRGGAKQNAPHRVACAHDNAACSSRHLSNDRKPIGANGKTARLAHGLGRKLR